MGVRIKFPRKFGFYSGAIKTTASLKFTQTTIAVTTTATNDWYYLNDLKSRIMDLEVYIILAFVISLLCILCVVTYGIYKCAKTFCVRRNSSQPAQPPIRMVDLSHNSSNPLPEIAFIEPPKPIPPYSSKKFC